MSLVFIDSILTLSPTIDNQIFDYVRDITGGVLKAGDVLFLPYSAEFIPPNGALYSQVITDDAFFVPDNQTVFSIECLESLYNIKAVTHENQYTACNVYSFDSLNVIIRSFFQ